MTQRNTSSKSAISHSSRNRALKNLLKGMDKSTVDSFTSKQLIALENAVNVREWQKHSIDFRPTLVLPFIPRDFYIVFLLGVNKRELSSSEKFMAFAMFLLVIFIFSVAALGLFFLIIYLVKSALGIDIFPNGSLGIWDEFKHFFNN